MAEFKYKYICQQVESKSQLFSVYQCHSSSSTSMPVAGCIAIAYKSVQEIRSFQANDILHCDLEK